MNECWKQEYHQEAMQRQNITETEAQRRIQQIQQTAVQQLIHYTEQYQE